jgi:predicted nucleic acid-binding protein
VTPFLDTNVLVYAVLSDDPRRQVAEQSLAAGGTVSVEVLNEFANVARNKLKRPGSVSRRHLRLCAAEQGVCATYRY